LDSYCAVGKERPDLGVCRECPSKVPARGNIEQVPRTRPASASAVDCSDQLSALACGNGTGNLREPRIFEH
jgi:hypothetical protein